MCIESCNIYLQSGNNDKFLCCPGSLSREAIINFFLFQDDIHEEVTREANGLTFQTLNRLTFSAQRELTSLSCFASNKALDERKGVHLVQSTTINVKFKPEVLLTPANKSRIIHAVEGEPLAVTCNFKANPMVGANIKWYKNGHLLENHPNKPSKSTEYFFSFSVIDKMIDYFLLGYVIRCWTSA